MQTVDGTSIIPLNSSVSLVMCFYAFSEWGPYSCVQTLMMVYCRSDHRHAFQGCISVSETTAIKRSCSSSFSPPDEIKKMLITHNQSRKRNETGDSFFFSSLYLYEFLLM